MQLNQRRLFFFFFFFFFKYLFQCVIFKIFKKSTIFSFFFIFFTFFFHLAEKMRRPFFTKNEILQNFYNFYNFLQFLQFLQNFYKFYKIFTNSQNLFYTLLISVINKYNIRNHLWLKLLLIVLHFKNF